MSKQMGLHLFIAMCAAVLAALALLLLPISILMATGIGVLAFLYWELRKRAQQV
jgi:4-hydroxybenzoate polyprenyltransferase